MSHLSYEKAPAHNPACCVIGFLSNFSCLRLVAKLLDPLPPLHPPWNPWNIQSSQGTGQGVSMTFNAASRLRSLEERSAALGSSRCELPGMHSVPKSAVLPYASGVGGLSRRLLNRTPCIAAAGHSPSSAMGRTAVPPTQLHRTSVSPGALGDAQLPETRFCTKSPPQERISGAPGRPSEKHHEHRFAQHPHSKIQRADVRLLGGYLRQE